MRDMYMRSGQGFLLVYDVTNRASFAEVPVFRNQILTAKDADHVPLVIIGNKCDIEDAREVSTADGMELAKSFGADFFEGSAKFRKNVDEAFFAVVKPDHFTSCACLKCILTHGLQVRLVRAERQRKQAAKQETQGKATSGSAPQKKQFCSLL